MSSNARQLVTNPYTHSIVHEAKYERNSVKNDSLVMKFLSLHVTQYLGRRALDGDGGGADRVSPGGPNPGHH